MKICKILFLLCSAFLPLAYSEDVFLITSKCNCITNSSSAIIFNGDIDDTKEGVHPSTIYPVVKYADINCNFKDQCDNYDLWQKDGWYIRTSYNSRAEVITDQRWEDFPIYKTIFNKKENLKYTKVLDGLQNFVNISISIRIKQEAHIFLCDSYYEYYEPPYSNCYWIILGGNQGTLSKIRKCRTQQISYNPSEYPSAKFKECKLGLNITNINPLNENEWKHFIIYKNGHVLRVIHNNRTFLGIDDLDNPFNVRKMFIQSRYGNGLWKIHLFTYLESTQYLVNEPFNPFGNAIKKKGNICISMFVKTSDTSILHIRLNNNILNFNTQGLWQSIKFCSNLTDEETPLYMRREVKGVGDPYWAIDNVKECYETEYRSITTSNNNEICQLISLQRSISLGQKNYLSKDITTEGINCPKNSFGTTCIPCNILPFGGVCPDGLKYCQEDTKRCYCSAGYRGIDCNEVCANGTFGHGCLQEGHCLSSYNNVDGKCYGQCEEPFEGYACNITKAPFFKEPPKVFDVKSTSFKIQQDDLTHTGEGSHYYFEYSKNDTNDWVRIDNGGKISITQSKSVDVSGLEADTDYKIRAIIESRKSRTGSNKYSKKLKVISTMCTPIESNDIIIESTNISALITFQLSKESCKITKYSYSINDNKFKLIRNKSITLGDLEPFTNYTVTFQGKYVVVKNFTTKEGVPSKVGEIVAKSYSTSLELKWDEPKRKNGIIIEYEINYRLIGNKACNTESKNNEYRKKIATETSLKIDDLNPYSSYVIKIRAKTSQFEGEDTIKEIETLESNDLETISIDAIVPYRTFISLKLKKVDCDELKGPLYIKIDALCLSEWCNNNLTTEIHHYAIFGNGEYVYLFTLLPFTNYNITVGVSRNTNNNTWVQSDFREITTESGVPNAVRDFDVYSKDENSISLRWRPPYPPTGNIKQFTIDYYYKYYYYGLKTNGPTINLPIEKAKCQLWHDFFCTKIDIGKKNYYFNITIYAQNKKPTENGSPNYILFQNKDEAPEPPYGLSYAWTESNELYLSWYHPNKTNGLLKSFEIIEDYKPSTLKKIESENQYVLRYKMKYDISINNYCTNKTLQIRSHNVHYPSELIPIVIPLPPRDPPQPREVNIILSSTNTTIPILIDTKNVTVNKTIITIHKTAEKNSRVVFRKINFNRPLIFEIGNETFRSDDLDNPPLEMGVKYTVNTLFINECNGLKRSSRITKEISTRGVAADTNTDEINNNNDSNSSNENGLWALLLLGVIPFIIFVVIYSRKKNIKVSELLGSKDGRKTDELPLTDQESNPKPSTARVNVVKPKATITPSIKSQHSKLIPVVDFEKYVKISIENGELHRQHNMFPKGLLKPHEVGSMPINKNRNRYRNLIAYDHTRVKLTNQADSENQGYINANYIDGYKKPRAYIATQGPKTNTLNDFWWMVWTQNVHNIVMLANIYENEKKKVEKYWPDINEEKIFGPIKVKFMSEEVHANFTLRKFMVQHQLEERELFQMHYTTWPDHGVPLYSQSLVPFLQRLLKIPHNTQTPILVHCSAGVGRTGTIILSDIVLRMAAGEGKLDFLAHLEKLRNQRANLVDNVEQYKLAHLVVLECLFGMRTSIPCNEEMGNIVNVTVNNGGIKTEMMYILETQWQDGAMEAMLDVNEILPVCQEKNRFNDIIPGKYRLYLSRYPVNDETSSYINAVSVNDFNIPGRFVVTQQPLPNTLGDFWRLVYEQNCTVIVSLNVLNLDDKTVCQFWPDEDPLTPCDFIKLTQKKTQKQNIYTITTIQMEIQQKNSPVENKEVNIISLDNWNREDLLPNSIEEFLTFREAADALSRNSEKIIVTCYDGAKASGLYLAMSFIVEQMKLEQECDVCLAVRSIRHSRKEFVTSEEQYEFLYRAAVAFITGFQQYSNFA